MGECDSMFQRLAVDKKDISCLNELSASGC